MPSFAHVRDGSIVPGATSVHVPSEPGSAQLAHCPHVVFVVQQTPSTQNVPALHSSSLPHVVPLSFLRTQALPLQ